MLKSIAVGTALCSFTSAAVVRRNFEIMQPAPPAEAPAVPAGTFEIMQPAAPAEAPAIPAFEPVPPATMEEVAPAPEALPAEAPAVEVPYVETPIDTLSVPTPQRDLVLAAEDSQPPAPVISEDEARANIVGGQVTSAKKWMASLGYFNRYSQYKHYCGVSFINDRWAVTAAHCINTYYIKGDKIRASGSDLNNANSFIVYSIVDFAVHPQYGALSKNDIALLKVDRSHPGPYIKLPNINQTPPTGSLLTVTGWGYTTANSQVVSQYLRSVQVPVVSQQKCVASYPNNKIGDTQICAGFEAGGKDSCQGDSGGPLYMGSDLDATIVGVVSYGLGCAQAKYYGVYTRVSEYLEWIKLKTATTNNVPTSRDVRTDGRCNGFWYAPSGKVATCPAGKCCGSNNLCQACTGTQSGTQSGMGSFDQTGTTPIGSFGFM